MKNRILIGLAILLMSLACLSCNEAQDGDSSTDARPAEGLAVPEDMPQAKSDDQPAERPNPCASQSTPGSMRMRGTLQYGPEGMLFTPCDATQPLPFSDDENGLLAQQLLRMGNESGSLYVQLDVAIDNDGMQLDQLWRASPSGRSLGCREDLSGLLLLARGVNPYWGVEVRGSRVIALLMPTDDGSGIHETLFDFTEMQQEAERTTYRGTNREDGSGIELVITVNGTQDPESGDWFGMTARLEYSGGSLSGVAWPGELAEMPAAAAAEVDPDAAAGGL